MKTISFLLASIVLALGPVAAAEAPPTRAARVAGGEKVQLVASARSPSEWSAARPQVRDLRPKVRGNFD
jgi:hypothetical protein